MALNESSGETESESESRARYDKALCSLLTDDEFRDMARLLGVSEQDEQTRKDVAIRIILPLRMRQRLSAKEERRELQAVQIAASRLHDALEEMLKSNSKSAVLLGLTIEPLTDWNDEEVERNYGEGQVLGDWYLDPSPSASGLTGCSSQIFSRKTLRAGRPCWFSHSHCHSSTAFVAGLMRRSMNIYPYTRLSEAAASASLWLPRPTNRPMLLSQKRYFAF